MAVLDKNGTEYLWEKAKEKFAAKDDVPEIPEGAVLYTEQSLTDSQKAQARGNIGVVSETDSMAFSMPAIAYGKGALIANAVDLMMREADAEMDGLSLWHVSEKTIPDCGDNYPVGLMTLFVSMGDKMFAVGGIASAEFRDDGSVVVYGDAFAVSVPNDNFSVGSAVFPKKGIYFGGSVTESGAQIATALSFAWCDLSDDASGVPEDFFEGSEGGFSDTLTWDESDALSSSVVTDGDFEGSINYLLPHRHNLTVEDLYTYGFTATLSVEDSYGNISEKVIDIPAGASEDKMDEASVMEFDSGFSVFLLCLVFSNDGYVSAIKLKNGDVYTRVSSITIHGKANAFSIVGTQTVNTDYLPFMGSKTEDETAVLTETTLTLKANSDGTTVEDSIAIYTKADDLVAGADEWSSAYELVEGEKYSVTIDAVKKIDSAKKILVGQPDGYNMTVRCLGNPSIYTSEVTDEGVWSYKDTTDNGMDFCLMFVYVSKGNFVTKQLVLRKTGTENVDVTISFSKIVYGNAKILEASLPESVSGVIIRSSTSGSTKKFKLTVDDTGTISATEVV